MTGRYQPPERIRPDHETDEFDCGADAETQWLRRHALQADRSDTSNVFVVTLHGTKRVVGFHALATGSVGPDEAPPRVLKGVGRYPAVPVMILTRLAVDRSEQGSGLGRSLVVDALHRVAAGAEHIAARALLIHAETPEARDFYMNLAEFQPSPTDPLHLFLLMSDLRGILERTD